MSPNDHDHDLEILKQQFAEALRREVASMIIRGVSPPQIERHLELRRDHFAALMRQKQFEVAAKEIFRLGELIESGSQEGH